MPAPSTTAASLLTGPANEDSGSHFENAIYAWMAKYGLMLTRIALGIIFLWFGAMKFLPGVSPIDQLAEKTLGDISFHLFRPVTCLHVLACFECVIGFGLLSGLYRRVTLILLLLQLPGTFLPLILLRSETWIHFPFIPALEGQYIIKNFVLVAAAIVVGSAMRGGKIIANPVVAAKAEKEEDLIELETRAA